MLETFIREMPDYQIDDDRNLAYPLVGVILGYSRVPLRLDARAGA